MKLKLLLGAKALLTVAFVAAGSAKLIGLQPMVEIFDQVGFGQWFRYVTGAIEVIGAVLLWVRGRQVFGAAMLVATMVGAVLSHIFILGPSAIPALVLGVLAAFVLYEHRDQVTGG